MTRSRLAQQLRVLLDAQSARIVVIELDVSAARELVRDLDMADYTRGASTQYRTARVMGEC